MDECLCVRNHNPKPAYYQHHHIVPQSWMAAGAKPADPEIAVLCGTAHDAVHDLLNQYVHAGGKPPWAVLRKYNGYVRGLAEVAWERRPNNKPPYTLSSGAKP
jgi:hypothetical protein